MSDSSPPAATTQTTELPAWAQGSAQNLLARGEALSNQPMPVYSGPRSADQNGYQTTANQMVMDRATNGSPTFNAGQSNLNSTLNGDYLNPSSNPYLSGAIDTASRGLVRNYQAATNGTDATFARNGAFGGSAWNQAKSNDSYNLAQGLGDLSNNMAYQNYGTERGNQMQALGMAPTYANQAYTDANALSQVGQNQYAYDNQKVQDNMNAWTQQAQSPYQQLDVLGNTIRAAVGGGGTTASTVPGPSYLSQGLGLAALGGGLLK